MDEQSSGCTIGGERSLAVRTEDARKGLLKAMLAKFSSTPIVSSSSNDDFPFESMGTTNEIELRQQLDETDSEVLTQPERDYLSSLLDSGDVDSLRTASQVLQDESVFPVEPLADETSKEPQQQNDVTPSPRSTHLQQHLFRIHSGEHNHRIQQFIQNKNSILSMASSESFHARAPSPETEILLSEERTQPPRTPSSVATAGPDSDTTGNDSSLFKKCNPSIATPWETDYNNNKGTGSATVLQQNNGNDTKISQQQTPLAGEDEDPYNDITSWLDGSLGVEVSGDGSVVVPQERTTPNTNGNASTTFSILGTSADDVSCHPHVLSPPLMESLLQFVPDTGEAVNNFWLKYSLVRDGPGLWNFLRQTRASTLCFLAIETDTGHVFGAFTSQPWRLSVGWYGGVDSFLWKLRRSRVENETKSSVLEQIQAESEVQVYPYRAGHKAVQYCSKQCLMLGNAEIIPCPVVVPEGTTSTDEDDNNNENVDKKHESSNDNNTDHHRFHQQPIGLNGGSHYGHGLYLDKSLLTGSTSTSETFGNPCLVDTNKRGEQFRVSNVELWTLTPHSTVTEAEQSELSSLFLERTDPSRLNVYTILVGGPI